MYLTISRSDLMYVMSLASSYMEKPTELHIMAIKRILRYLKSRSNIRIYYKKGGNDKVVAYSDSDYTGDLDDRRNTSGYVFVMSSRVVLWCSKKQVVVILSTNEGEFISAVVCAYQAIWVQRILII